MLPSVLTRRTGQHSRVHAVRQWVRRQLGGTFHEHRVAGIAVRMFDLCASLHELGAADRRLLVLAALLHDVGRCDGARKHHVRGAKMILRDAELPLNTAQRRALAFLTRYHRGRIPEHGEERYLRRGDNRRRMRSVLALLRAADTLDNRRMDSPTLVMQLEGRRLKIRCFMNNAASSTRPFERRKKFRLLEDTLGLRVGVKVCSF